MVTNNLRSVGIAGLYNIILCLLHLYVLCLFTVLLIMVTNIQLTWNSLCMKVSDRSLEFRVKYVLHCRVVEIYDKAYTIILCTY